MKKILLTILCSLLLLSGCSNQSYRDGYADGYSDGYQDALKSNQISNPTSQIIPDADAIVPTMPEIKMPTVSRPANCQIFRYSVSASKPHAPLEITTPSGDTDYFFIVEHLWDNTKNAKFYVYSGTTMEINMAPGEYEIYYASGTKWYGTKYLFGEGTQYHKFSETFEFSDGCGWTVEMKKTSNGNLDSEMVDATDFPQ